MSNGEYNVDTSEWYIITTISALTWILAVYPVVDSVYRICCENGDDNDDRFNSKSKQRIQRLMNILVCLSFIGFFLHLTDHIIFRLIQHIPGGLQINNDWCKIHTVNITCFYYFGKFSLYSFFIVRAWLTFDGTHIPYSGKRMLVLISILFIVHILLSYFFASLLFDRIFVSITSDNGRICVITDADNTENIRQFDAMFIFLTINVIIDILIAFGTVYMLVGKLFQLTHASARVRGKHKFRFTSLTGMCQKIKYYNTYTIFAQSVAIEFGFMFATICCSYTALY